MDYFLNRDGSRVTLGEGGFGKVYKGKLLDGTLVAIKALKRFTGASIDASGGEGDLEKGSGGGKGVDGSGGDSGGKGFGSSDGSDGNGGISSDETGERSSQGSKPKKGSAFSPFGSLFSSRPALRGGSRGSGTGSGTGSSSTGSGTRSSNDEGRRASAAAEESKKLTRQLVDEAAILQQCDHECLVHFYGEGTGGAGRCEWARAASFDGRSPSHCSPSSALLPPWPPNTPLSQAPACCPLRSCW